MARKPSMGGNSAGKLTELKTRLLFVLGAIIVYRMGAHIPVPGTKLKKQK